MKRFEMSGSSCHRWLKCPGSVELSTKAPPQGTNPAAEEGTAAHELAEKCIIEGKHPREFKHTVFNEHTVDDEMIEGIVLYMNTLKGDLKKYGLSKKNMFIEQTFEAENNVEGKPGIGGTPDAYIFADKGIIVYDFKYGRNVEVNPKDNKQMLFYMSLILQATGIDVEWAEFVIVQPRRPHPDGYVRRFKVDVDYIDKWKDELKAGVKKVNEESGTLHAGSHCKWCPALTMCPEAEKETMAVAKVEFASIESLTPENIANILDKREFIESFLKGVFVHAARLAESGVKIPGYKLVSKRARRQWGDKEAVIEKFIKEFGAEIYETDQLLSPARLEKIVGKDAVKPFIVREGGISFVSENDSREEINCFSEFKEIGGTNESNITKE